MRTKRMALAAALAGMLAPSIVSAAQPAPSSAGSLRYPSSSANLVGYEYDNYYQPAEPPSPSDQPPAAEQPAPTQVRRVFRSSGPAKNCFSDDYEPYRLFDDGDFAQRTGINMQGWIAQSYTQNFYSPRDRFNGPVTWLDRSNEYQLNEIYAIFKRDPNNDGEGFAWGYRWDLMYGTSARFCTAAGLEDGINKTSRFYALAMPSINLQFAYNDLKVTVGHFLSPVGFFAVGTYNNFFNTLPYTFQYGEPFTHMGALAQYQMTDDFNLGLGIVRGWDNVTGIQNGVGPMSIITRSNLLKEGDSLAYFNIWSNEQGLDGAYGPPAAIGSLSGRYLQTIVYSRPITENLTWIIQSDFGVQTNPFGPPGATIATNFPTTAAHWYGVNQYFFYKVNNCWSWGLNLEWFTDDSGIRVGGFLPNVTNTPTAIRGLPSGIDAANPFRGGYAGNFWQITFGPRWSPHPNVIIRPNLRWDWFTGNVDTARNPGGFLPYGDGLMNTQGILGTDIVTVW